jgi:DNA-binding MarR family transcriptional regulator
MDRMLFPGFSLSEAGRLYVRRFEKRSRNLALEFAQCRALLVLAENEGVTQRRLSELTAIAAPWLGRTLDRLEALGPAEHAIGLPIAGRALFSSRRKPRFSCQRCGISSMSPCAKR